ncbi:adenyl-nucleotide exchange factor sse1, partial [Coemansia sp. RSA 1933]
GDPVVERYREDKERPKAARELRDTIAQWADRATSQEERYAHITQEERQKVIDRIEKVQEWLDERLEKQAAHTKWEAPLVFSSDIRKERESLVYFANPIMSRPKPAEPKPEEQKPDAPEEEEQNGGEKMADEEPKTNGDTNEMDVD